MNTTRSVSQRLGHIAACLAIAASLTAACAPGAPVRSSAPFQVVQPALHQPGAPLPAPRGAADLTVNGLISITNASDELRLDLATIEQLGLVQYTVNDPWRKESVTYTGVLLRDLLTYAGASTSAQSIHLVALDDYEEEITLKEIRRWPILLATRSEGGAMPIEDGGPTRIIYPIHAFQIDPSYETKWVWSIKTIRVK